MACDWDLTSANNQSLAHEVTRFIKKTLDLTVEGLWSIFRALLLPSRELGGFTFNTNPLEISKAKKTIDNLST
jgi:hypothetical protein